MKSKQVPSTIVCGIVSLCLCVPLPAADKGATGEQTAPADALATACDTIRDDPAAASEKEMLAALKTAAEEARPHPAERALRSFLAAHPKPSRTLLRKGIDSAIMGGDYTTAVVRCKEYLKDADTGPAASAVVVLMYRLQIEMLDEQDDAYRAMSTGVDALCRGMDARRFDSWFLATAKRKRDCIRLADRLAAICSAGMPVPQVRYHYGEYIDDLFDGFASTHKLDPAAAAAALRKLAAATADKTLAARAALYAANLQFHADYEIAKLTKRKPKLAPEKVTEAGAAIRKILGAARTYVARAQTAVALREAMDLLSGGDGKRRRAYMQEAMLGDAKRELMVSLFLKLPLQQQRRFLRGGYDRTWAGSAEWNRMVTKRPAAFEKQGNPAVDDYDITSMSRADWKKLGAHFAESGAEKVVAMRALSSSGDFAGCAEHLVTGESWRFTEYERLNAILHHHIWPAFKEHHNRDRKKEEHIGEEFRNEVLLAFGGKHIPCTPIAFDAWTVGDYVYRAWRFGEKTNMAAVLDTVAWIPFDNEQRKKVFNRSYDEFKGWVEDIRRNVAESEKKKKAADRGVAEIEKRIAQKKKERGALGGDEEKKRKQIDAQLAKLNAEREKRTAAAKKIAQRLAAIRDGVKLISPLEDAFKRAMAPASAAKLKKAPNELCRALGGAIMAVRSGNPAAFVAAAEKVYPHVKKYESGKTPVGRGILAFLVNPSEKLDIFDFQQKIVADQVRGYDGGTGPAERRVRMVIDEMFKSRPGWRPGRIPSRDREKALALNDIYAAALMKLVDRGAFSPWLFDAVLNTRRGHEWGDTPADRGRNEDLLAKMIEKDALAGCDRRYDGRFAATSYMALIREQFPGLRKKYPPETFFDDRFLAEAKKHRFVDLAYFENGGQDTDGKVRAMAAEIVAKIDAVPPAADHRPAKYAYTRNEFFDLQQEALRAKPAAVKGMLAAVENRYGNTRFDRFAMGAGRFAQSMAREDFFATLAAYLETAEKSPVPVFIPALRPLEKIPPDEITDDERALLVRGLKGALVPGDARRRNRRGDIRTLALAVAGTLKATGGDAELLALSSHLWHAGKIDGEVRKTLLAMTNDFFERKQYALSAVFSTVGLRRFPGKQSERLRDILSKSISEVGRLNPLDRSDPNYPILAAQAEYLSGNTEQAWRHYLENRKLAVAAIRQLDATFTVWLIDRNTRMRDFKNAETLARAAIQWTDAEGDHFAPQVRARILLAYADIAFARKEYPRAKALYGRIAATDEFSGTRAGDTAQFQVAAVERVTGHYMEALDILEKLMDRPDRHIQTEGHYQTARVLYDQEKYVESLKHLEQVFSLDPSHSAGRILEGRVNLRIKRLERASRIKVGFSADKKYIVPGKSLVVSMQDQTLSIAGDTMSLELVVRAASGDEEYFNMVPFADSKTQFEGNIPTALGPANKGDHILQVIGSDTVTFGFSESFRTAHNISASMSQTLSVISDAMLYASSGKIRTEEEIREAQLERMIRSRLKLESDRSASVALSGKRPVDQVKPGNPINVRVVDADRSTTADADGIAVTLATTSGDTVTGTLTENGTHSGIFEAAVPTASAPATAFATDSKQGTMPAFVISSGDHPAWVAQPDNRRPKTFSVDLNAAEKLGKMRIEADVPGRKLKQFLIQVSPDGKEFETVGGWPSKNAAWDGAPRLAVLKLNEDARKIRGVDDMRVALGIAPPDKKKVTPLKRPAAELKIGSRGGIAHVQAAFHMPARKMRTIRVVPETTRGAADYFLAIDGTPGRALQPNKDGGGKTAAPVEFKGVLGQGVHRLDMYIRTRGNTETTFDILSDIAQPPYLAPSPATMFSLEDNPVMADWFADRSVTVAAADDGGAFDIAFGPGVTARIIRLLLADFETDAPAIDTIHLTAADGRRILPSTLDLLALKENDTLEVVPGDRISVTYRDPRCIDEENRVKETFLSATFANGELHAALLTGYTTGDDNLRTPVYTPLRRFKPDDVICVIIDDPDGDTTDKPDTMTFTARTGDGEPVTLRALETEKHSGVFLGKVFPVTGTPQRASEIAVGEGEDLVFAYRDETNTDPGIPWRREVIVESVVYVDPELRVFDMESTPLPPDELAAELQRRSPDEFVPARKTLAALRPAAVTPETDPRAVVGAPLTVELLWPTIAQTAISEATIYLQTSSGRAAAAEAGAQPAAGTGTGAAGTPAEKKPAATTGAGGAAEPGFDITVPGTIRCTTVPGRVSGGEAPPGYKSYVVVGDPNATGPMDDGRFMFSVPVQLGPVPETTLATDEAYENAAGEDYRDVLMVRGGDEICIGFQYTDEKDNPHWITRTVSLAVEPFFDVMERGYGTIAEGVYVGDSTYFRIIDPSRDVSPERDRIAVTVTSAAGGTQEIRLTETFAHTGVFKSPVRFRYAGGDEKDLSGEIAVRYGEKITATYAPGDEIDPIVRTLTVFKGADGEVQPFTKRFKDPAKAVKTKLTIAEAHFELAKKHRRSGRTALTEKHIATGKRLLEESLKNYPDNEARAQVDYLLANLSLELAAETEDAATRKKHHLDALSRFASIVSTYGDSSYAPKSQYKKALTLEKMGRIDRACEEYVKLSYRWPENPLIAETIARLGQYFVRKAKALEKQAEETEGDAVEQEKSRIAAREKYVTAAKVFGRLPARFPTHTLAIKTRAVSAQCFMKAEDFEEAIEAFEKVVNNEQAPKELVAESMYWIADCRMKRKELLSAYRRFKDLTYDYPESKWARYARGRLAGEEMTRLEEKLDAAAEE